MASRQEEKERRRREREEAERAAQRGDQTRKRLAIVLGAVVAVAVVVIVILAVSAGGDDNGKSTAGTKAPAFGVKDLNQAAKLAGCRVQTLPSEGRGHTTGKVSYMSNPPTSGRHNPVPAQDGAYAPNNPPATEQSVHALEHGRVLIQYKPGTPQARISQLEGVFNESVRGTPGYHTLLFANQTNMPYAVAATAWTHSLTCPRFTDRAFDAIRAFRLKYVDQGPERVP